jgi:hypothetical protein
MLEFEWDEAKAEVNFHKHGVTFEQAAYAFQDSFAVEWIDERVAFEEERVILLGMSRGQILTIVYTDREERIRIISARRATKHEKNVYYRQNAS